VAKKYREIRSALSAAGWEVVRQRGSHEVWAKPGENARIVVARTPRLAVPQRRYIVGTLSPRRTLPRHGCPQLLQAAAST